MVVKIISMFRTFFHLSGAKVFVLLRVNLYRNYLRGNKNCFELAGDSSYRG